MKNRFDMKSYRYIYLVLFATLCFVTACDDSETPPQAAATFTTPSTIIHVNEELQFTNTSQNATAFKWSFGDGTTSKDVAPKKSWTEGGVYLVTLVSTGAGGSSISSVSITVEPDEIYYIDMNALKLRKVALDAGAKVTDILDLEGRAGVGLAYDAEHKKIYYSDYETEGEGKIWRMNLDGSEAQVIVDGLYSPYQITLDVAGGKIYWSDDTNDEDISHIGRANLDGSNIERELVAKEDASFIGIAVDPDNSKMYYYDYNEEILYVSNLDGSEEDIFLDGLFGFNVVVDTVHDKIYFDDQRAKGLMRADLDGDNVEKVDNVETDIYGIVIDYKNNKLLWSGRDSGVIARANLDGSEKEILKAGVDNVLGIVLKN
jgi:PKD repeat protein